MTHHHSEHSEQRPARVPVRLPEIYMPAMPPLALMEAIGRWVHARRRRRALEQLLALDCHLLADIGLDRERVTQALRRRAGRAKLGHGAAKARDCA